MQKYFQQFIKELSKNSIKLYLILANLVLVVFAIWFSNVGLLPFKSVGDFAFFVALALIFALYRPGWAFVLFIGAIALENINLAPLSIGLAIRPYQLFGFLTLLGITLRYLAGRPVVTLPKFHWTDGMAILFAIGGFLSVLGSANKGLSLKQAIVATSFVALYLLVRIYVQSLDDLKRITPFFLSSGLVLSAYAIWQNARFALGKMSFEVMPGRPNGTFTEPDWLGVYLVFLLSIILTIIYYQNKKIQPNRALLITSYGLLITIFIALILTVSRSAWLGALVVILAFLKITLIYGEASLIDNKQNGFWSNVLVAIKKPWHWKKFFRTAGFTAGIFLLSLGIVYVFNLTTFQLGSRVQSTGGMQKITIACQGGLDVAVPQKIANVEELVNYQCRHINLEEIEKEKTLGSIVQEVYRPDPNVGIRGKIYRIVFEQIKQRPLLGIGWGSISSILGNDERGAGLNASNIFLEAWLGAGLVGFLSLGIIFGYVLICACIEFAKTDGLNIQATFILLTGFAIVVPNLFNSGIFLGFFWVYLAIDVGLLKNKK